MTTSESCFPAMREKATPPSHDIFPLRPPQVLVLMLQKLYALGAGRIASDNPDSLVHQEVLLPGQLWCMLFKERLEQLLETLRQQLERELRPREEIAELPVLNGLKWFKNAFDRIGHASEIGKALEYFLATGNLISESGLDLQQTSGFTIVAERLNYWRYLPSHLASPHLTPKNKYPTAGISRTFVRYIAARSLRSSARRLFASCYPTLGASYAQCTRQTAPLVDYSTIWREGAQSRSVPLSALTSSPTSRKRSRMLGP